MQDQRVCPSVYARANIFGQRGEFGTRRLAEKTTHPSKRTSSTSCRMRSTSSTDRAFLACGRFSSRYVSPSSSVERVSWATGAVAAACERQRKWGKWAGRRVCRLSERELTVRSAAISESMFKAVETWVSCAENVALRRRHPQVGPNSPSERRRTKNPADLR